jgi:hypothetical protein
MTVKKLVAALTAVVLVLLGAAGFVALRYTSDQIARWFLPADVTLNRLSGVSLGWRGGGIEQLDVTTPQGQLITEEIRWIWQPKISITLPLQLISVSADEITWLASSQPDDPPASAIAAPLQLQMDDFRKSTWWPAVEAAEVEVKRLSLALGEESAEVTMSAPIDLQQGAITAESRDQRIDMMWTQQAATHWQMSASLAGPRELTAEWVVQTHDDQLMFDGELQLADLPISHSNIAVTLNPFLSSKSATPMLSFSVTTDASIPEPAEGRVLGLQVNGQLTADGAGELSATMALVESPFETESLAGEIHAIWHKSFASPQVRLVGGELSLMELVLGDQKISQIETGLSGEWDHEAGIASLDTTEVTLAASGPGWIADMRSSGLSVNGGTEDVSASGSVQIDAQTQGKVLPSLDAVMSLNAGREIIEAEVSGFAPWGAFGQLSVRYPLSMEPASFAAYLDSALWDWQVFQAELSAIDAELAAVEVANLNFTLNAEGQYDQSGLTATVSGQASDGYLSNDSVGLAGLAVEPFELRIQDDAFALVNSLSFSMEGISAGVPITDLTGTVDYDQGSWVLTHAEGEALGGALIIDQFRDFSRDGPLGTVTLNDIDLAAVVEIAGTEGVNIQGRATAALPLIWQNGKILVDAGTLSGTPGTLQYQPSIDPSQIDQRVGAVAAALSNLRFEQLDADITLNEGGVMFLSTSVLGSNPDYQNGRQVKLNLTLENNLLSLLQSLQTIESVNLWVTRQFEQQN